MTLPAAVTRPIVCACEALPLEARGVALAVELQLVRHLRERATV